MSGSSQGRQPAGVYGQLGDPATGNTPGGRSATISWTDASGNFWLFGSQEYGFDGNGVAAYLDDVWEYDASTQEWTWMAGSNSVPTGSPSGCIICAAPPAFGSYQTPAAGNTPGSLQSPVQWTDKAGNLWLFGGQDLDIVGGSTNYELSNALWEFNVSSHEWAWMGGSNAVNGATPGVYGTLGKAAPGNTPGGRTASNAWIDSNGNLWLFGGLGQDSAGNEGYLNDLWMFTPSNNQWTWMGGSGAAFSGTCLTETEACSAPGVPGTLQTPAAGNIPMGRSGAVTWTDMHGNIWLFGGETAVSYDISGSSGYEGTFINDLWEFNSNSHEWAWMSGNASPTGNAPEYGNSPGVYGTLNTPSANNTPGGRVSRWMQTSSTWTDSNGNLWLFGGNGFDSVSKVGQLNDLWLFDTSLNEWAWMGGSSTLEAGCVNGSLTCSVPGVYGSLGTPSASNAPGARSGAAQSTDRNGNIWLLGGWGTDSVGTWGYLNDLWRFTPSTDLWTWMGGSSTVPNNGSNSEGQLGVYGALGVQAATNMPGGRQAAASWTDSSGNFWILGGYGCGGNFCQGWLNDLWVYQPPTPEPSFSPAPGTYASIQSVAISDAESDAVIYYTTNGTTPNTSSAKYTGPITVSSSETLEAFAVAPGASSSTVASASYTINLPPPSFTFTGVPGAVTLSAGSSGAYSLTITPQNGFNGTVSFACSGLPTGAGCTFNPSTVAPAGAPVSTQLTLTTSAQSASAQQDGSRGSLPTLALATLFGFFGWRKRRSLTLLIIVAAFVCLGMISGCGGGSQSQTSTTQTRQPQTSVVTVTATSGTLQQSATVSLTVN
jgi:N-acetylneuraminic acid mutarotase